MKRTVVFVLLTATLSGACGSDPGVPVGQPTAQTSAPATIASSTTTSITATPVTTRAIAPPKPAPTVPSTVPVAWKTCTATAEGYSIGYPGAWLTDSADLTKCRYFDPEPVVYEPNSDGYLFALMVGWANQSFEVARRPNSGPASRTLIHEETTVGARRAVRYEVEDNSDNIVPVGSRFYGYMVERGDLAFRVSTYWFPGQPLATFQERKDTVDRAVRTLRFV